MAHASAGHVKIVGTAILANPRAIDPQRGMRHLAFDANFNVPDGNKKPTLGLLRYFVPDHLANQIANLRKEEFTQAFISANISAIDPTSPEVVRLVSDDLEIEDYAFTGDIKELLLVEGKVDIKRRPYIDILGSVTSCDTYKHTFTLEPNQYIALMHNSTPFKAYVFTTDSKRWGDKKPKPPVGTTTLIGGYLDNIKRNGDRTVNVYEVELDDITYVSTQARGSGDTGKAGNASKNRHSKTRFNFDEEVPNTPDASSVNVSEHKKRSAGEALDDEKGEKGDEKDSEVKAKKKRLDSS